MIIKTNEIESTEFSGISTEIEKKYGVVGDLNDIATNHILTLDENFDIDQYKITELLKNRVAGQVGKIEIRADEMDVYFNNEIPDEDEIDYECIAEYIINANK